MNYKILSLLLLAAISQPATADALRSVDKNGNITFSDAPVAGSVESETISIDAAPPSRDSLNASQREAQAIIDKANRIDTGSQSKTQPGQSTKQRVESARKELEASKVVREGDRQGKAGGGTRLKPEYHERVRKAEQALKDAEAGKAN
jgi:hypothetical protein